MANPSLLLECFISGFITLDKDNKSCFHLWVHLFWQISVWIAKLWWCLNHRCWRCALPRWQDGGFCYKSNEPDWTEIFHRAERDICLCLGLWVLAHLPHCCNLLLQHQPPDVGDFGHHLQSWSKILAPLHLSENAQLLPEKCCNYKCFGIHMFIYFVCIGKTF